MNADESPMPGKDGLRRGQERHHHWECRQQSSHQHRYSVQVPEHCDRLSEVTISERIKAARRERPVLTLVPLGNGGLRRSTRSQPRRSAASKRDPQNRQRWRASTTACVGAIYRNIFGAERRLRAVHDGAVYAGCGARIFQIWSPNVPGRARKVSCGHRNGHGAEVHVGAGPVEVLYQSAPVSPATEVVTKGCPRLLITFDLAMLPSIQESTASQVHSQSSICTLTYSSSGELAVAV
jgi:hypothetical protein